MQAKSTSSAKSWVVQILILVAVTIITSYLTTVQASIPRNEATKLITESEARADKSIDKLSDKQDQMLEKLEDLRVRIAVIGERVGVGTTPNPSASTTNVVVNKPSNESGKDK